MKQQYKLLPWKLIVSGFGSGYIPLAPGTMGSLGALIPAILILKMTSSPNLILLILIVIFTVLGIAGAEKLKYSWGKDPSRIVVDEMVGMWISLLWIGNNNILFIAAFLLFRLFDIYKPLGIRKMEELPGGMGVMADDMLAGIYANLVIRLTVFIFSFFV
ncbi:MAG: phosphatidylglycerophosphatase A [Syntrophothermus sp.]